MTLESAIKEQKCRKEKIDGTSKDGRFWLACEPLVLKDTGNGWDTPEDTFELHLRHFENEKVEAVVRQKGKWIRNNLSWKNDYSIPALLTCSTVEDIIVVLKKGIKTMEGFIDDSRQPSELIKECFDECNCKYLASSLTKLGVLESRPGPDEVTI